MKYGFFKRFGLCCTLSIALSACQPVKQDYRPRLQDVALSQTFVQAGDGAQLPLRRWLPQGPRQPRAAILALHGFNDYSNAFAIPSETLAAQGIALYAYDQRGFGSSPQRGVWGGIDNLTQDARQVVESVIAAHPGIPVYLLGESMGGAVVVTLLAEQDIPGLSGGILVAPALWGRDTLNPIYRGTLWLGAHTLPGMTLTGRGLKILASDNIPMLIALGKDPQIIKETRIDAIYGIVGLMDLAYDRIGEVNEPLLILYGANDQVIPPYAVRSSLDRITAPYRFAYYPDGYHMLMRDLQGEVVTRDIARWIATPDAPLPSGADEDWQTRFVPQD